MDYLNRAQVREIDRLATEQYRIPSIVLMENASRAVAKAVRDELPDTAGRILLLAGGGNNGGDALAAARHLHNDGFAVRIGLTIDPARYKGDALINYQIVRAMGLPTFQATPQAVASECCDLVVDGIFGTGLTEPPREPFEALVDAIEAKDVGVVAIDLPSGLDCDRGDPLGACVTARKTITFVARKLGFSNPKSAQFTGKVTVAGIGCPRELIDAVRGLGIEDSP